MSLFSFLRLAAVIRKEFIQMRRDRLTFGMLVGVPLIQMLLFGYAINTDPHHLPTAVLCADPGPFSRAIISTLQVSGYFELIPGEPDEKEARELFREGETQFILSIPPNFERDLLRGDRPEILLEADATDPSAVANAVSSLGTLLNQAVFQELTGPLERLRPRADPFDLRVHLNYNPERRTQVNIVPGLIGVILTNTMVFITALSLTREIERGTMENLLATPVRPLEVMLGKIAPFIVIAYVQVALILIGARILFHVPMEGSVSLLLAVSLVFILGNLAVGMTFSSLARNQLQAVQMAVFFFLPSMLLSGFMFPFRGMPGWAQAIGNVLPLTHYLPVVRGILLKGNGWREIAPHFWPLLAFFLAALAVGLIRYRRTLD